MWSDYDRQVTKKKRTRKKKKLPKEGEEGVDDDDEEEEEEEEEEIDEDEDEDAEDYVKKRPKKAPAQDILVKRRHEDLDMLNEQIKEYQEIVRPKFNQMINALPESRYIKLLSDG